MRSLLATCSLLAPLTFAACAGSSPSTSVPVQARAAFAGVQPANGGFVLALDGGGSLSVDVSGWTCTPAPDGCATAPAWPAVAPAGWSCSAEPAPAGTFSAHCAASGSSLTFRATGDRFELSAESATGTIHAEGQHAAGSASGTWSFQSNTCNCDGSGSFAAVR